MAKLSQATDLKTKRLYLSMEDKKWAGVCGGIAEYFVIDSTIIRVAWVLVTILTGFVPGFIAYLIIAVIIPKKVEDK